MDKLIIPKDCTLQGEIRSAINQGDIVIENGSIPGAVKSDEGSIRLVVEENETNCETISAQNGIVEIQAKEFQCRRILARAAQLSATRFSAEEILSCEEQITLEAQTIAIEECRAGKVEIKGDQVHIKKVHADDELVIQAQHAEIEEIVAKKIVLQGSIKCRRVAAEETVLVDSGKIVIKALECKTFHAAPEVKGIVVLATCEEVRAEGVRGFLQPDELDMLGDGATTADLTKLFSGPRISEISQETSEEGEDVSFQPPDEPEEEEIQTEVLSDPLEETPTTEDGVSEPNPLDEEPAAAEPEPLTSEEPPPPASGYPTIPEVDAFEVPPDPKPEEPVLESEEPEDPAPQTDLPESGESSSPNWEMATQLEEPLSPADAEEESNDAQEIGKFMKEHMEDDPETDAGEEAAQENFAAVDTREFESLSPSEELLEEEAIPPFSVSDSLDNPEVALEELSEDELEDSLDDSDLHEDSLDDDSDPHLDHDDLEAIEEVDESDDSLPEIQGLEGGDEIEVTTDAFTDDEVLERVDAFDIMDEIPEEDEAPESLEDLEVLDEASLESVEIGSEDEPPEDALVRDLIQILNQVRAYFHEGEDPKFIAQIHRYLEDRRFDLFMKTRNKEAVLAKFDKFDHAEISALARSFFNKLEAYQEQHINN